MVCDSPENFKPHHKPPLWKAVILWIAVLPAAFLASSVVIWLSMAVTWLSSNFYGFGTWFDIGWDQIATNALSGYAFVYCGANVAPTGKNVVAITLSGMVVFLSGITVLMAIHDKKWLDLLGVISLVAATIVCATHISRSNYRD